MNFKRLYILILFGVLILSCKQESIEYVDKVVLSSKDSSLLFSSLDSLSHNYISNNDSLIFLSDIIVSKFPYQTAEVNIKIAHLHFSKANYVLAEHYFNQSAQEYLKDSLHEKYAEQLTNIGVVNEMLGSYTEATKKYLEALKIFDDLKLELKSSMIYNNLGIVYQQLKENDKALEHYKKSLHITEKLNREDISAKRYNNIASVYEELNYDLDSSLFYYQKAYAIWSRDSENTFLPIVENNIGYIYLLKNELSLADSLFKKALRFCVDNGQMNNLSQIYRNQANLFLAQKKYSLAIQKAHEAINLAQANSNKEIEYESLSVLIEALEKTKDFEKANVKLKEYFQIQEELRGIEQKNQINQLNIEYQVREKEHLIQILTLENKVQERTLWQQWLLIVVLVLVLSGLYFVFRLQKKNNQLKFLHMQRDISDYLSQIDEIKDQNNQDYENLSLKIKQFDLTEREEDVLILISKGFKNSEIAEKMFVSVNTVKTHTKNIFLKLDVRNRTEAARKTKLS